MSRQRFTDIGWQYCKMIDGNHCHVRCNFCGHTMWGGVSRFKEHLAQKRGDVIVCNSCPPDVIMRIQEHLIELSRAKERKQKMNREKLEEDMRRLNNAEANHEQPRLPAINTAKLDAEERDLINQAIENSLESHEMEKRMAKHEDDELEAACRESMLSYREEMLWRGGGEGSSTTSQASGAGPSSYEYDSDLSF